MLYVACALFAGGLMALITLWTIEFFNREKIMAKNTKAGIDENLSSPFFTKRLEEAKRMVESDEKAKAAYHLLKHMNLSSRENDPSLFSHIPNRQLAELLGIPGGKSTVWGQRQRLIRERWGVENVVNNVDASKVKILGKGSESVYLYYFPTYQLFNKLHLDVGYFPCNIGKTVGDVKARVRDQIGSQLPEIPKIALILKTDDCDALEKKIHDELKRRGDWLDPNSDANVVGVEWFLTNPAAVEGIVRSIHRQNGEKQRSYHRSEYQ